MCVHVHVHAQSLSHPAGMAMLQVWSLVGRWHSQCGVSSPKIDSRTPTNVNHQYLTVYSIVDCQVWWLTFAGASFCAFV